MTKVALDSNILVYAHSFTDEGKMLIARDLLEEHSVVSSQVISEYLNVMRYRFKREKNELIETCSVWLEGCTVQPVVLSTIKLAQALIGRYDFQLFDGIVVAAALEADCEILYSEDMHNGQVVEKTLKIINPFV